MTALESCPDDLFARARAGSISVREQDQLDRHIAGCSACRAMLFLSRGFEQRLPAQANDTQVLARMVDRVRAARSPAAATPATGGAATRRRTRLGALLVAALLTGGVATASAVPAARGFVQRLVASFARPEPAPVSATRPAPNRQNPPLVAAPADPTPAAAPEVPSPVEPLPSPATAAVVSERKPSAALAARARDGEAPRPDGAERLFAEANARRKAGDTAGARRLYMELAKRYPGSPEAQVSNASLGRLLLERADDPEGALEQFDRLLARPAANMAQPALAEEALFGRATALMRLGRTKDEKQTWLELLKRYPGSVYTERANERLRALK